MSLLDRLRGAEKPKIPGHPFQAAISEWSVGAAGFTRASIITGFELTVADEPELDALKAIWDSANTPAKKLSLRKAFDNILMLVTGIYPWYDTKAKITARLNDAAS